MARRIPRDEFLYEQRVMRVVSSNVATASYDDEEEFLTITYKNGSSYIYARVSEIEARTFWYASASSPGRWIWSNLRVRGSKTMHRKPYWLLDAA